MVGYTPAALSGPLIGAAMVAFLLALFCIAMIALNLIFSDWSWRHAPVILWKHLLIPALILLAALIVSPLIALIQFDGPYPAFGFVIMVAIPVWIAAARLGREQS